MRASNQAETTVELKGVHLCCGGCTDAVDEAAAGVPGVESRCHMGSQSVTLTGSPGAIQQALEAVAAAGFHGETGDDRLAMKPQGDLPRGKVKLLKLSGIHNCCDLCCDAIKGAVASVPGVTGDTAEPGGTSFEVAGDFEPDALLHALHAAGFNARASLIVLAMGHKPSPSGDSFRFCGVRL